MGTRVLQAKNGVSDCPMCGGKGTRGPHLGNGSWSYVKCGACDELSLDPMPSEEELTAYYNENYAVSREGYERGTERNAPPILKELAERIPSRGKLLEVGCSYGYFLQKAQADGWETTGIELDERAAEYAKAELGLAVRSGTLEGEIASLEPSYDAIVSFHVIEHVRDPIHFLRLCRGLLRDKGVVVLKTPNVASWIARRAGAHWQWLSPPAHIHLFSPSSLGVVLKRTGFKVEEMWSQRGDAHSNLFELVCAFGRGLRTGRNVRQSANGNGSERARWGNRWQVNAAEAVSDALYFPVGKAVDPWLGRKGLQPELLAIARAEWLNQ